MAINSAAIRWHDDHLELLDQRRLPAETVWLPVHGSDDAASAIRDMVVRGAPAIGITAAYGLALEAARLGDSASAAALAPAIATLAASRPTAVNLFWALERLQTLAYVRDAGMKICSGGILGMGESVEDRAGLLIQLANLPEHPESVPINMLVKVKGTPLAEEEDVDPFDFIRMLAVARIMMPESHVRLSAGREQMNEQMQALAFLAGANSIFYGEKLLTTGNPQADKDMRLFARLGIQPEAREEHADEVHQAAIEQALMEQRDSNLFYSAV